MRRISAKHIMKWTSVTGLAVCTAVCVVGCQKGIFSSPERLRSLIAGAGAAGSVLFILLQAVGVVIPILPGGIGCLAGVLLFGAWKGFAFNYIGICAGSVLAFLIAKYLGRPVLHALFPEKTIRKYETWTSEKGRFAKLFAAAIVLPVAPDDFLCYMAGTTEMSLPKFTAIILLGKPFAIAMYSCGLTAVFRQVTSMIGG